MHLRMVKVRVCTCRLLGWRLIMRTPPSNRACFGLTLRQVPCCEAACSGNPMPQTSQTIFICWPQLPKFECSLHPNALFLLLYPFLPFYLSTCLPFLNLFYLSTFLPFCLSTFLTFYQLTILYRSLFTYGRQPP
jgi:hypothetical protein